MQNVPEWLQTMDETVMRWIGEHLRVPALDGLVSDCCEYRRGASSGVGRSVVLSDLAGRSLFDFSPLGPMFPRLCGYRQLLSSVMGNPFYGPMFRRAQEAGSGSKPGPNTKENLSE